MECTLEKKKECCALARMGLTLVKVEEVKQQLGLALQWEPEGSTRGFMLVAYEQLTGHPYEKAGGE